MNKRKCFFFETLINPTPLRQIPIKGFLKMRGIYNQARPCLSTLIIFSLISNINQIPVLVFENPLLDTWNQIFYVQNSVTAKICFLPHLNKICIHLCPVRGSEWSGLGGSHGCPQGAFGTDFYDKSTRTVVGTML